MSESELGETHFRLYRSTGQFRRVGHGYNQPFSQNFFSFDFPFFLFLLSTLPIRQCSPSHCDTLDADILSVIASARSW